MTEAKYQVFMEIEKTFDKRDALNPTVTSLWRPIFNHENEGIDQADCAACKTRFATTHYPNATYMMEEDYEWIVQHFYFLETYIGQLCWLISLQMFKEEGRLYRRTVAVFSSRETDVIHKLAKMN